MAGIITNVDSDVQKLRKLKNEIEEVKKALKGINIKVDVDIAKGMEAQLKSLTDQYNALVTKVAEAEGKILLSTKRINDASEKIIKAQDKLSKVTGVTAQPVSQNTPSSNISETASIQLQAKAYDELRDEIDSVIGTRSQNIKRMIEESNAIRLINAEIKKITKSQGESSAFSSAQQTRLEQLNNSLLTHKTALAEVRQNLSNNVKMDNAAATSMNGLSQSLSRMRMTYRELTEEERKSPFGKELLTSINQADAKIKELDATIGNHQRNVGHYASGWNGLGMSVQQIVRELPAAKMGLNMFFLAISNNIPILVDEINRAKVANERLKVSGQSSTPVWKQVASSLFSWQSAMMVGITLLTMYGKDIVNWVGSLFNANEALKETKRFQDALNQSMRDANKDIIDETTKLNILYRAATDAKKSVEERTFAVRELKKEFPSYFGLMDDEKIKAGKAAGAYKLLTDSIIASVKARKTEKLIVSEQNKYLDYLGKTTIAYQEMKKAQDKLKQSESIYNKIKTKENKEIYEIDKRTLERRKEEYNKARAKSQKQAENVYNLTTTINASKLYGSQKDRDKATIENKEFWTTQKNNAEAALDSIASAQKELMDTGKFEGIPKDVVNQYKQAIKLKANADKALEVYDYHSKQDSEADKLRQQQQKSSEELLSLRRKNQQDEINLMKEGSEKKLKQIELDYRKEIDAIKKQEKEWSDKQGGKLTGEQSVEISARYTHAENKKEKSIADLTKEELKVEADAMRDYLKEYGTFQQQKLAIAQEYAEKIKKAATGGERLSLERERDAAIQQVDIDALNQKIDWQSVFGNFSGILGSQLKETLDGLKAYVNTDKFRNSSEADKKVIYEAIERLREVTPGGEGTLNFNKIQQQMDNLGGAINKLQIATLNQEIASQNLKKAENEYTDALRTGDKGAIGNAKQALDLARLGANAASDAYKSAESDVENFGNNLRDVGADTVDGLNSVAIGLQNFADGTLPGVFRGLQNILTGLSKLNIGGAVGDAIGKLSQTLSSAGVIGQIISAILSILDILKDGIGPLISSIIDTVLNAINGILDNILSGDIFVQIFSSIKDGIGNILNTISFGGWNSLMDKINGSNAKEVAETTERLTDSNERLKDAVDKLKDEMSKTGGWKAIDTAKQAKVDQETINRQTNQILQEQMGYHGSHHSNAYYWGLGWQDYNSINQTLSSYARKNNKAASRVNSLDDMYKLTPEEMDYIRTYNVEMWKKMLDQGKYDKSDYWEQYADLAGELEKINEALKETLTQTSFDGLRDSFIDSLMDMNKSAKDFADDFQEYMMRSILNAKISDLLDKDLQNFYDNWANYAESGNELTEDEQNALNEEWNRLTQKGLEIRDQIASFTGYDSSSSTPQESTKKGFAAASQDSIEELSGRFTALQIIGEEIKSQNDIQSQSLNILTVKADSILLVNTDSRNIADEIRTIQVNSYLELQEIRENTGAIIKPIQQMQKDIAEVKNNTKGLSSK